MVTTMYWTGKERNVKKQQHLSLTNFNQIERKIEWQQRFPRKKKTQEILRHKRKRQVNLSKSKLYQENKFI